MSLKQIVSQIKNKKISAFELASDYAKRVTAHNPGINAFLSMNENLLNEAKLIDDRLSKGENFNSQKLLGIPVGIKDLICTQGLKTTAASKILSNFISPYDATLIQKIKQHGGLVQGKLNLDEFAMGSSNETSFFGACKNPWNLEYVPGGSSGGSAAALAANMSPVTIGTDTGGSIRQPASFCGVVGLKPTYGRISRYGIIAYASSLDQAGPMTNCVEDAALMLEVMAGFDAYDGTTTQRPVENFSEQLTPSIKGMKIGLLKEFMTDYLDKDVQKTLLAGVESFKKLGAEVVEVSVPYTEYSVPAYYLIASSEASSNLSRYDGVRFGYRHQFANLSSIDLDLFYSRTRGEGFGAEVKRRILMGTQCLSSGYIDAYYGKASQVRRLIKSQFTEALKQCDLILSPVSTTAAFKLGERIEDPLKMYLNDIFTVSTNLAGLPALSLPYGKNELGLPIGVQLIGRDFDEQTLLNVAYALEMTSEQKEKKPQRYL